MFNFLCEKSLSHSFSGLLNYTAQFNIESTESNETNLHSTEKCLQRKISKGFKSSAKIFDPFIFFKSFGVMLS